MTAIKYFASPILSDTIEGVERNKDIPLEYSKDITEDSLICFDMEFDRDSKNGQGFVFNTPKIVC